MGGFMLKGKQKTGVLIICILIATAAAIITDALSRSRTVRNTAHVAARTEKALAERMAILKDWSDRALSANPDEWIGDLPIPEDMVLYRYVDDSLTSWCNRFPLKNDNINVKVFYPRLSRPQENIISPLAEVTSEASFVNYGHKWYLVRSEILNNRKVISGLEIIDAQKSDSPDGINHRLLSGNAFSIVPLSETGGSPVRLDGIPVFKVVNNDLTSASLLAHSVLVWAAIGLIIIALMLYLNSRRSIKRLLLVLPILYLIIICTHFWGQTIKDSSSLFSPLVYADGRIFNSIGDAFIYSMTVFLTICAFYMTREDLYRKILSCKNRKGSLAIFGISVSLLLGCMFFYTHWLIRSILFNSNITLELYRLNDLTYTSLFVHATLILLAIGGLFLFLLLCTCLKRLFRFKGKPNSTINRAIFSTLLALWLVTDISVFGFQKEQNRVEVWANRLSIERDIRLELELRMQEELIASDIYLNTFAAMRNSGYFIRNRIIENYLGRFSQDYDIGVEMFRDEMKTPQSVAYFTGMVSNGIPIHENSRFRYHSDENGNHMYVGSFSFYTESDGVTMMLLTISPKSNRLDKGYGKILGYSKPGEVLMPSAYSYAKYSDGNMTSCRGNYAYPMHLDYEAFKEYVDTPNRVLRSNGYVHFINKVSDSMIILISRQRIEIAFYVVTFLLNALVIYLLITIMTLPRKRRPRKEKNYYKSQINSAMMLALIMTLISLAGVSVAFVNKRNNSNMMSSMADKVTFLQSYLQSKLRFADNPNVLLTPEASEVVEEASNTLKADITLYNTGGREIRSTTPEVFDRMLLPTRIDPNVYENIVYKNRRYFINRERIGSKKVYFLYAPVFNASGKMMAIMASPYTDDNLDFKTDALLHSISIVIVFMILLLLARFITASAVNKMFKPLTEMGRKMNEANIENLEYIIYDRDDEVSQLVRAYNLMVHDLYESTTQLTTSERDKAWATMARQVAHEIKNPLTPIKLQIQRLIRLKSNGNPVWMERFDDVSRDVLNQIDILTETANDFSTFAKLYMEEPVEIDLDKLISEEVFLFDVKENIKFTYMGLKDAIINGPKPQLARVLTNLLGNAIQAIELKQEAEREAGSPITEGLVYVSLRYSTKEGFYDIVIEDNGPGVSEENRSKLFTPNFTTKSNGTGLGLSICRSILERCNGEITYSRSYSLKGACFTVRYPIHSA
ncbi:MAG: ATP-binding protein [Candidatus Cryptobacteroides sp.]